MQALSISESSRPPALTHAPMSASVAANWHQLQAETMKESHSPATVPPGATVLPALPALASDDYYFSHHGNTHMLAIGSSDNSDTYSKRHRCPDSWVGLVKWNPAHWTQSLCRTDAQGRAWTCSGGDYVIDDFGSLVQVPA